MRHIDPRSWFSENPKPSHIWNNLWLGSYSQASQLSSLHDCRISHILIVADNAKPRFPDQITYKHLTVEDSLAGNLFPLFTEAFLFLLSITKLSKYVQEHHLADEIENKTDDTAQKCSKEPRSPRFSQHPGVLVHCYAGVSRSASMVIGFLMLIWNKPYELVLEAVQKKRSVVDPNIGFVRQLTLFQSDVYLIHQLFQQKKTSLNCNQNTTIKIVGDDEQPSDKAQTQAQNEAQAQAQDQDQAQDEEDQELRIHLVQAVEHYLLSFQFKAKQFISELEFEYKTNAKNMGVMLYTIGVDPAKLQNWLYLKKHQLDWWKKKSSHLSTELSNCHAIYACHFCHRHLFTSFHIFEWHQKTKKEKGKDGCDWIFTELIDWMYFQTKEGPEDGGKVRCPDETCQTEVGRFHWNNLDCLDCEQNFKPGFAFLSQKLITFPLSTLWTP